jgi:hypothetical protein
MNELDSIGKKHGTDKVHHGYMVFYTRNFEKYKNKKLNLLEIGVYRGASLKTWEEYFPNGSIFGIDDGTLSSKDSIIGLTSGRIKTFIADQKNRQQLESAISGIDGLDIIIDDGLHFQEHQQVSIGFLFKYLKNGGLYIIEDLYPRVYNRGWGITTQACITTNVLEEFRSIKKINSPYINEEEKSYMEKNIDQIDIHYISEESIIAFIKKIP